MHDRVKVSKSPSSRDRKRPEVKGSCGKGTCFGDGNVPVFVVAIPFRKGENGTLPQALARVSSPRATDFG